jgi:hypothetical protein
MLNVNRNYLQVFNSLGVNCFFFISLYPFVTSLLNVGNNVCFLKHTMLNHRTMAPM